jgi:hypothetical protein
MIPLLLWRCPLCAVNDAVVHTSRQFRPDLVRCTHCGAEWRMRRVPGDNFYLKLVKGTSGVGDERLLAPCGTGLADWYAAMKRTVRLAPIHDSAALLQPGEVLYLASGPAQLQVEEDDPLFFPERGDELSTAEKREVGGVTVGRGRLFLTNRRLVWLGEVLPAVVSFPLTRVNSVYAMMDFGVVFLIEMRLYAVYFLEESLLKWVTYAALVARQVLAETGHRITTSHF